jgi:tRNA dimethylallyltransferase
MTENNDNNSLIAVIGPTATGKSELAINLALEFNGEIISADSRQVYRYMDIGTAKLRQEEMSGVPHYLIDIKNPDEEFSLAQYQLSAKEYIVDIQRRGKIPILAGGSGLYVWALLEGWEIPRVKPDLELRKKLEEQVAGGDINELYRELREIDPEAAESIDPRNVRRVIRALEVSRQSDKPFSRLKSKQKPPFHSLIIGLTAKRQELYSRIDIRVDSMMRNGLVEEVKRLVDMGYGPEIPAMSGIGYKQILMFLRDEISLDSAVYQIKTETHRLVRKQNNWFKLTDERIKWLDIEQDYITSAYNLVRDFLSGNKKEKV